MDKTNFPIPNVDNTYPSCLLSKGEVEDQGVKSVVIGMMTIIRIERDGKRYLCYYTEEFPGNPPNDLILLQAVSYFLRRAYVASFMAKAGDPFVTHDPDPRPELERVKLLKNHPIFTGMKKMED